jgi:hypothetical protein
VRCFIAMKQFETFYRALNWIDVAEGVVFLLATAI